MLSKAIAEEVELAINDGPKAVTVSCRDRRQRVQQEEIDLVAEMMRRGEISLVHDGEVSRFEKAFAEYIGSRYCRAFNNGPAPCSPLSLRSV